MRAWGFRTVQGLGGALGVLGLMVASCTHDWDRFDPDRRNAEPDADAVGEVGIPPGEVSCAQQGRGPAMVGVPTEGGGYCIDATEVTRGHYREFLTSVGNIPVTEPPCSHNATLVPSAQWPPQTLSEELLPVAFVDWCDARAFCEWAGKRLCGRIGGGDYDVDSVANAQRSEWFNACSAGDSRKFPYGDTYQPGACRGGDNGPDGGEPAPSAAGTTPACVGGVPNLFDMSGNVFEWDGACVFDQSASQNSRCAYRGGGFRSSEESLTCRQSANQGIAEASVAIGFRCCADPSTATGDAGAADAGDEASRDVDVIDDANQTDGDDRDASPEAG